MTHRARCRLAVWWILAACAGARGLRAQTVVIRQGTEFRVNSYTSGHQTYPKVALDGDGDFVVTWSSQTQDGNEYGVFARRYSSSGETQGADLQVNTFFTSRQNGSSVAAESDGDFVVVWQSLNQEGAGGLQGVFGQRFDSAGMKIAGEFQINLHTLDYQRYPAIGAASDGSFVVAWQSAAQDGSSWGVFARRFDPAGVALGGELLVNNVTVSAQQRPALAVAPDGAFVVAWDVNAHDGDNYGVFARSFDSSGNGQEFQFQVNSYTTGSQRNATIAVRSDGDFVIAWQSAGQDGQDDGIFARRVSSAGALVATEFQVNAYTPGYQRLPAASSDADGDLVIAWQANHDGSDAGIFARRFDSTGMAVGDELQVNTVIGNVQARSAIDFDADGDFVVAWHSPHDAGTIGVFAQRFSLPTLATLDVDGNGLLEPLADGMLILRDHFGFTLTGLTSGAVAANCTRCDGQAITDYLTGLGLTLDVDGDGVLEPLYDGVLTIRFLFGFSGPALMDGALPPGCTVRCDSDSIRTYLQMFD